MNLLCIELGTDFSILNSDLKADLYFFVDSRPQSIVPYNGKSFIRSVKTELKRLGWIKVKRYEFRASCKLRQKYQCDGVMLYRTKNYKKFLYYFYSANFPNKTDYPVNQFIRKSNIVFLKTANSIHSVIHAMTVIDDEQITIIVHPDFLSTTVSLTFSERDMLQKIQNWMIFEETTGSVKQSSYEEIFEKFGFIENKL